MLLQRRDRLDVELLQQPLQQAAGAIAAALKPGAAPVPAQEEASTMLALPADSERDLSPWLLRRLRLAVALAQDLAADRARALEGGARS